ncbi:MAG: PDZ domain-containing protein [Acidobacteria bacterium]|nr:PDZ domain-containing protein [Acidobacteriota bacterium]
MTGQPDSDFRVEPSAIRAIVKKSVDLLESKCIRLGDVAPDWRGLFAANEASLERASSRAAFETEMNRVLAQGRLSHVAFFHSSGSSAPARYAINATFCSADLNGAGERWMFQDVHPGGPAERAGIRPGDILLEVNGKPSMPPSLPTFTLGQDADLLVSRGDGSTASINVVLPKAPANGKPGAKPPMAEPTSVTASMLDQEVGYLRVAFFPGVNGQRFAREFESALASIGECRRLVVDLRGNLGGFVGSLRLMSSLTPDRTPVGYSLTRKGSDRGWRRESLPCVDHLPKGRLDVLRMALRFLVLNRDRSIRLTTEGLGARPFHGRVVMLINEHTLSAGEMVAAFAAENRLATLVGTRTGGQVLGGGNFAVGFGFVLRLPAAAWFMWSGAAVEGVGVVPHIGVPAHFQSYKCGVDGQLAAALETLGTL